jgi:cobalt-zinc-cadmium resistance protein CzcA
LSGASYIYREQQQRYLPIKFSVRDRDLGGAIQEAQAKIAAEVPLPPGLRMEWVGEFGNLQDAIARLKVVVPLSLVMIAMLLWINFGSITDTLLAMSVIPMAIIGGVLALFVTGIPFSVSAAIGSIALFGIAVMDGIIVLSQYNNLIDGGLERTVAAVRTGALQMRPVLMTCIIAGVGLFPAAMSAGIGSQVQKPLAVVVVGGMMVAPILILVILPRSDLDVFPSKGRPAARLAPMPRRSIVTAQQESFAADVLSRISGQVGFKLDFCKVGKGGDGVL